MERFFNTAGPMNCTKHYSIDPLGRLDWEETCMLIHDERYFVLQAPRVMNVSTDSPSLSGGHNVTIENANQLTNRMIRIIL